MFDTLNGEESEEELAGRLGAYLELTGSAPLAVVRRALVDTGFMSRLAASRHSPELLEVLFRDPRNRAFETPSDGAQQRAATNHSNAALIRSGARAALRFAASGLETVDPETLDARLAACRACPALVEPPRRLLYSVQLGPRSDPRVCSECGCPVSRKARMASERCPREDPQRLGYDRWGSARAEGNP